MATLTVAEDAVSMCAAVQPCIVLCIELLCDRQSCVGISALDCPACHALTLQAFVWLFKGVYMLTDANRPHASLVLGRARC